MKLRPNLNCKLVYPVQSLPPLPALPHKWMWADLKQTESYCGALQITDTPLVRTMYPEVQHLLPTPGSQSALRYNPTICGAFFSFSYVEEITE